MESDTRRNVLMFYVNYLVVALIGFLINPLLLGALGPIVFGVWKSLQRYLDFATVADGRASQALKWIVASRTTLTAAERQRDIGAAILVWFRWLPIAAVVAGGITAGVPLLIKGLPEDVTSVAYMCAGILAANTVLAGLLSIPDSVLSGINQSYKSVLVTTVVFVVSNAAMVAAAFAQWPLWTLALIVLLAAVLNGGITLLVARQSVRWWGVRRPTRPDMRRVLGYSAWTLGGVVVDKLYFATELIVFSIMIGATAVTQYTFTTYAMQFALALALVTASGFTPLLGSLLGASDIAAAAERARLIRQLVIGVIVLGSGAVLAFNGALVALWVGREQYLGTSLNALLVLCSLQLALIRMDGQILDVTMRIAPKVIIGFVSSVGGVVGGCIGYALTHKLEIALLAVVATRLLSNVLYPILVARSIPNSGVRGRQLVVSIALLGASFAIGPAAEVGNAPIRCGFVVLWLCLFGAAIWYGLLPRAALASLIRSRR